MTLSAYARRTLLAISLAVAISLMPGVGSATTLDVWISAFIPDRHPTLQGYISKTRAGTSVIGAPRIPGFTGTCFATDDRWFKAEPNASARIRVRVKLEINGPSMSILGTPERFIGESHHVDCTSGEALSSPRRASNVSISVGDVSRDNFRRALFVRAAVANPYFPHISVSAANMTLSSSPDIDFSISIQYDVRRGEVVVEGTVGYFPAFEAYYILDSGPPVELFRLPPNKGATAFSLIDLSLGINTRNVSGTIDVRP